MATYKFDQFNIQIKDPTWGICSVTDNYDNTCVVDIILKTDSASFGISLSGFEYQDTWEDSDVFDFIPTKLKEYEV